MEPLDLVKKYINTVNVLQLATSVNDDPWVCNLHYYADENLNLYWISTEERKHSKHIAKNPQVAAAIKVHENTEDADFVIGITIQGIAELIGDDPGDKIGKGFIHKHNKPEKLLDDIESGANPHKFYVLRPTKIVLFDSKEFPNQPRQETTL